MAQFNLILFILGGFFVAISSINPKKPHPHAEETDSDIEMEMAND